MAMSRPLEERLCPRLDTCVYNSYALQRAPGWQLNYSNLEEQEDG